MENRGRMMILALVCLVGAMQIHQAFNLRAGAKQVQTDSTDSIPAGSWDDRAWVLDAVEKDGRNLQYASARLRNDRDIVMAALKQWGVYLEYASADLKNDRDIVMAAIKTTGGTAIEFASPTLRSDRDMFLAAIMQGPPGGWNLQVGEVFAMATAEQKNDRGIVMAALAKGLSQLKDASPELQNDREIVMFGVQHMVSLCDVPSHFQGDFDIVMASTTSSWFRTGLQCASAELRGNADIVRAAVNNDGNNLQYASANLKNDRDIVLAAIRKTPCALGFAPPDFQKDPDMRRAASGCEVCHTIGRYSQQCDHPYQ